MTAHPTPARDGASRRARRNQLVLFSGIAAAVLIVFAFWLLASGGKAPRLEARIDAELAGPGTAEESWTRRSETRFGAIETRLREMEAESRRLDRENLQLREQLRENANDARVVIDRQAAIIEDLRRGGMSGETGAARRPESGNYFPSEDTSQRAGGGGTTPLAMRPRHPRR